MNELAKSVHCATSYGKRRGSKNALVCVNFVNKGDDVTKAVRTLMTPFRTFTTKPFW